jgi:mono/diheme cytochrome c family protein
MDQKQLLLIARARMRWAMVLFAGTIVVVLLLVGQKIKRAEAYCGVVDNELPELVMERHARADSIRLQPIINRLGHKADLRNGRNTFKSHCAACHKPDKDLSGPALKGLLDRAPKPALQWYLAFIGKEDSLVRIGEPYTIALRDRWDNSPWLHPNRDLTREDLLDLLAWVEMYEARMVHVN